MKQIVTCKEMKALDGNMIEGIGIPSCVLMERAALKVAEELERMLADKKQEERILCVCGSGNNGGDGVAVARILKLHGYRTSLYLVGNPDHRTVEMQRQLDIAAACQVPVVNNLETEEYTTIVDAIFGVGLSRPVEGSYRDVIMALNQLNAWKVAVDIPSGVNGDTGAELGIAFQKGTHEEVAQELTETLEEMRNEGITEEIVKKYGLDADEILPGGKSK